MPAFGILVGKRRTTFIVMRGKKRKIVTLGNFPALGHPMIGMIDRIAELPRQRERHRRVQQFSL